MKLPSVEALRHLFTQVNADAAQTGESVVPLGDTNYYSLQIQHLFDVDEPAADALAVQLERRKEPR